VAEEPDGPTEPSAARRALRELVRVRAALVELEEALVAQARRELSTWEEIGGDLGVTRQTAYARHRPPRRRRARDRR
jgi:hypothetical protein